LNRADSPRTVKSAVALGLALFGLALAIRLAVVWPGRDVAGSDVAYWYVWAKGILDGDRIYTAEFVAEHHLATNRPPPWTYYTAATLVVSRATGLPFPLLIKLPSILVDSALGALIYLTLRGRLDARRALGWALAYVLQPATILVSAIEGQADPIFMLTTLAAIMILQRGEFTQRRADLAALVFGLGIALKFPPIMFVPLLGAWVWAHSPRRGLLDAARFGALTLVPWLLSLLPFMLAGEPGALTITLQYATAGGLTDSGAILLLHTLGVPIGGAFGVERVEVPSLGLLSDLIAWGWRRGKVTLGFKLLFAGVYGGLAWRLRERRDWNPTSMMRPAVLLFYLLGGIAAPRYVMWIMPFAALSLDWMLWLYLPFAGALEVLFLLRDHTRMLLGPAAPASIPSLEPVFLAANIALYLFQAAWLALIVARWLRARRATQTTEVALG
jgi:hypothetical protein